MGSAKQRIHSTNRGGRFVNCGAGRIIFFVSPDMAPVASNMFAA